MSSSVPTSAGVRGTAVAAAVAALVLASQPLAAQDVVAVPETAGAQLYRQYCAQCHGDDGRGQGIAAPFLRPAPRDFSSAKYRVRTTPTGALPTDADLERVIREGVPGTGMPGFGVLSDDQIDALVEVIKGFSPAFEDAARRADPIELPNDPGYSEDNLEEARRVYREIGCALCHGEEGRGDGRSAPTLVDDWGQPIRAADLTRPWTFRGGASRADVFMRISTGLNGTPMAGFAEALSEEQRWQLVDFITAISGGATSPGYDQLVVAQAVEGELDLGRGDELFAEAPPALFPVFGQIVQPGRQFQPSVVAVEVRAVFTDEEIAFQVSWHDIRADTAGANAPDLEVPEEESVLWVGRPPGGEPAASADPFADEVETAAATDPFAEEVETVPPAGEDFWGEEVADAAAAPAVAASEFSDAIAVQLPRQQPAGIRRPYFIFGDPQSAVELWFVDLARGDETQLWEGRGSDQLALAESGEPPEVTSAFAHGRWTVTFKRRRAPLEGIGFPDDTFVPVAFSVWDGFHRERGSKRGMTSWFDVYVPPADQPAVVVPMARAAGLVLLAELLLIGWTLWRRRRAPSPASEAPAAPAPT